MRKLLVLLILGLLLSLFGCTEKKEPQYINVSPEEAQKYVGPPVSTDSQPSEIIVAPPSLPGDGSSSGFKPAGDSQIPEEDDVMAPPPMPTD